MDSSWTFSQDKFKFLVLLLELDFLLGETAIALVLRQTQMFCT